MREWSGSTAISAYRGDNGGSCGSTLSSIGRTRNFQNNAEVFIPSIFRLAIRNSEAKRRSPPIRTNTKAIVCRQIVESIIKNPHQSAPPPAIGAKPRSGSAFSPHQIKSKNTDQKITTSPERRVGYDNGYSP